MFSEKPRIITLSTLINLCGNIKPIPMKKSSKDMVPVMTADDTSKIVIEEPVEEKPDEVVNDSNPSGEDIEWL